MATSLPRPYYDHGGITIYHADCRDVLPLLDVDLVVTDPPYGTGGRRRMASGNGSNPAGRIVRESWDNGDVSWIDGRNTVLTFFPPAATLSLLARAAEVGLTKHRAVYLHKPDPMPQYAGRMAYSVEPVWCLSRDGFLLMGGTDWFKHSTPRRRSDSGADWHPYQKPVEFMGWLLSKTSGSLVDPFMGTGTTLVAAKSRGRRAIGIELDERWCKIAVDRLAQECLGV